MPLLWEISQQVGQVKPGGVSNYFEESEQRFYIESGQIKTDYGKAASGKWDDIQDEQSGQQLSDVGYTLFDSEHNYNSRLHGVACKDGKIVYLMHTYKTE